MTIGKASALTAGFIGAVALGVLIGVSLPDRQSDVATSTAVEAPEPTAAPVEPRAVAKARPAVERRLEREAARIEVGAPELGDRLKPVLSRGTDVSKAADGFDSAEQFATVAHAAQNTKVPFVLLKHRVLTEGKSLSAAIKASKPDVDAAREAARARMQARGDLASIAG